MVYIHWYSNVPCNVRVKETGGGGLNFCSMSFVSIMQWGDTNSSKVSVQCFVSYVGGVNYICIGWTENSPYLSVSSNVQCV